MAQCHSTPQHSAHIPPSSKASRKKPAGGKQTSLTAVSILPMLAKTSVAIGLFCQPRCRASSRSAFHRPTRRRSTSASSRSLLPCTHSAAAGRVPASSARRWARLARAASSLVLLPAMTSFSGNTRCRSSNTFMLPTLTSCLRRCDRKRSRQTRARIRGRPGTRQQQEAAAARWPQPTRPQR